MLAAACLAKVEVAHGVDVAATYPARHRHWEDPSSLELAYQPALRRVHRKHAGVGTASWQQQRDRADVAEGQSGWGGRQHVVVLQRRTGRLRVRRGFAA